MKSQVSNFQKPIPERKELVLQAIRDYQKTHPHMNPCYRELLELTGITSTSVLKFYLDKLHAEGKIIRYHGVARGISAA